MTEREEWGEFSQRLERALELSAREREPWLEQLARIAPAHAQRIRKLLDSAPRMDAAGFLTAPAASLEPSSSLIGAQIGPWRIEAEIARGGMSSVWRARREDGRAHSLAAIKFVSFAALGREGEERFRREGRLLGRLDHPNIARLLDAGVYGQTHQPYLVLEYVEGVPIDEHCARAALDTRARIALFLRVLDAVAHAHGHLVVHRDLKPSNILVKGDGTVKLLDFGIAKLLEDGESITRSGLSPLTPQYAAPEQLLGREITTQTDVYALGLVLHRLLTGQHAVALDGRSQPELVRTALEAEPPLPSRVQPGLPELRGDLAGDLDNIVRKALRKAPDDRYGTVAAFAQDLARYLRSEPVSARPDTLPYRVSKFVRRNRGSVASAVLVAMALIATTAFALSQMLEARRQRDAARLEAERATAQTAFADQVLMQLAEQGERLTPELLLSRSVDFVEKRFEDRPDLAVGLLIHLSGRYMNRGDTAAELATLVKAERIAEHAESPTLLARVECNTVETELAAGRRDRARERLARGLAALARVPDPPMQLRFECANAEAILQQSEGDPRGAIAAATRGAHLLQDANETLSLMYASSTSMLVMLHLSQLEVREALAWNQRNLDALARGGLDRSELMASARLNRAQILAAAGRWVEALAVQREAVARLQGEASPAPLHPRLSSVLARCLAETGAARDAQDTFARALARARETGHDGALLEALIAGADLSRAEGDLEQARARLDEAERAVARDAVRRAPEATRLRVARAALALASGDAQSAQRALAAALAEIGDPARSRHLAAAPALRLASGLALARGDSEEARRFAQQALDFSRRVALDEARSADVGEAWLALARAQNAGDARRSAARAAAALRAGRGDAHPSTREALARAMGG